MIELKNVSKKFSGITVIDNISFKINSGNITGFLGRNGAGKTTVMRMITGFLRPDSGKIRINNKNIEKYGIYLKEKIGYLPENIRLYPEMRVYEYLKYRAVLKKINIKNINLCVTRVLEQCNIIDVKEKIIGHLSKGYTQRVGLADALLKNPEILILDEPTTGLDPNQRNQVLNLIKNIKQNKTIILSTHILSDVENVCQNVLIINSGSIVNQQKIKELSSNNNQYIIKIKTDDKDYVINKFDDLDCITDFKKLDYFDNELCLEVSFRNNTDSVDRFYNVIRKDDKIVLQEFRKFKNKLENIFIELIESSHKEK